MSAGHSHDSATGALSSQVIDRLLDDKAVMQHLHQGHVMDRDHDLPYLGGYSKDGGTIYIDRHLPEMLTYAHKGVKKEFNPAHFVAFHEKFEKAVMDGLGWRYGHAHEAANGYEKRHVMRAGMLWKPYNDALEPFIKADAHEKLKKVPANLDMAPYFYPPVDRKLIAHMEKAMGGGSEHKITKPEAGYSDHGHAGSHCGPVPGWPKGDCKHFQAPNKCELVRGYIVSKGWCRLFERNS